MIGDPMTHSAARSKSAGLLKGMTEGAYFQSRPDTEPAAMNAKGDSQMMAARQSLNPLDGYQTVEYPAQVPPTG